MARAGLIASLGLTLLASARAAYKSEVAQELENHYNGYPHTTPVAAAGAAVQSVPQNPQVNSFIPLVFFYQARLPFVAATYNYGTPFPAAVPRLITKEQNGGPGDVPTYLFNGQKPDVANNYPSLFPAKTGRKLLQEASITETSSLAAPVGSYPNTFSGNPSAPYTVITAALNSPSFEALKAAVASGLANLTTPTTGRKLLQSKPIILKLYGEVKKASDTGFPMLTYVFDFSTRPTTDLLTKPQPTGAVPVRASTLTFVSCTIYLPGGAFVTSAAGTCFDTTAPDPTTGVPQPVIVRLAAKSFYYGSGTLGANAGANGGTQVTPIASFAVNYADTVGAPRKSIIFQAGGTNGAPATAVVTQSYGVYADASGIYPGGVGK